MIKPNIHWTSSPNKIEFSHQDAHVWMVDLRKHYKTINNYKELLSEDELNRASQYHFEKDKRRFIIARGILRKLIAQYQSLNPEEVIFSYNSYGKPYLKQNEKARKLWFNLSHSEDMVLYIFSRRGSVGIDVEKIKQIENMEGIARHFFASHEYETLQSIPSHQKTESFYWCWTRKEAFIKKIGDGLAYPLEDFVVTIEPKESARLLKVRKNPELIDNLALIDLSPSDGYAAAVVLEKPFKSLKLWEYD